jgi:hypothetical protein
MPAIDPRPHFGTTSDVDDSRHIARVVVPDEETAACLDGLVMSSEEVVLPLLRLAVGAVTEAMHLDATDADGWGDTINFTNDLSVLSARMPLLVRCLQYRMRRRENKLSLAELEGWDAEIRELLVGKISGFKISGKERDALVREVRFSLKALHPDAEEHDRKKRELKAILRDTGKKKGTGEACTLSTLAMPALVEWLRLFGPDVTARGFYGLPKKTRKKLSRRHELICDMWGRVRREVEAGPKGGGC